MRTGIFTALITPFKPNGAIDRAALRQNIEFQIAQGVDGVVPCGSTGESPTLSPPEHLDLVKEVVHIVDGRVYVLAGTGSNNTDEAIEYSIEAVGNGVDGILPVDCYYNKPTSGQLVDYYYRPIAEAIFKIDPTVDVIPYVIPGRTGGTGLLPEDLLELVEHCPNVTGIKDAIGIRIASTRIRRLLGPDFVILCGDDGRAYEMMTSGDIAAQGLISVVSNALPEAVAKMVHLLRDGDSSQAADLQHDLATIFSLVSMKAIDPKRQRDSIYPNPCSIKYIMKLLGMDSGYLRPPLGPLPETAHTPLVMMLNLLAEHSHHLEPGFAAYGKPEIIGAYTH